MSKKKHIDRNLDGVYFLVERNGERDPICFSDLTDDDAKKILAGQDAEWLIGLYKMLMDTTKRLCQLIIDKGDADDLRILCRTYGIALKVIGDMLDIKGHSLDIEAPDNGYDCALGL